MYSVAQHAFALCIVAVSVVVLYDIFGDILGTLGALDTEHPFGSGKYSSVPHPDARIDTFDSKLSAATQQQINHDGNCSLWNCSCQLFSDFFKTAPGIWGRVSDLRSNNTRGMAKKFWISNQCKTYPTSETSSGAPECLTDFGHYNATIDQHYAGFVHPTWPKCSASTLVGGLETYDKRWQDKDETLSTGTWKSLPDHLNWNDVEIKRSKCIRALANYSDLKQYTKCSLDALKDKSCSATSRRLECDHLAKVYRVGKDDCLLNSTQLGFTFVPSGSRPSQSTPIKLKDHIICRPAFQHRTTVYIGDSIVEQLFDAFVSNIYLEKVEGEIRTRQLTQIETTGINDSSQLFLPNCLKNRYQTTKPLLLELVNNNGDVTCSTTLLHLHITKFSMCANTTELLIRANASTVVTQIGLWYDLPNNVDPNTGNLILGDRVQNEEKTMQQTQKFGHDSLALVLAIKAWMSTSTQNSAVWIGTMVQHFPKTGNYNKDFELSPNSECAARKEAITGPIDLLCSFRDKIAVRVILKAGMCTGWACPFRNSSDVIQPTMYFIPLLPQFRVAEHMHPGIHMGKRSHKLGLDCTHWCYAPGFFLNIFTRIETAVLHGLSVH